MDKFETTKVTGGTRYTKKEEELEAEAMDHAVEIGDPSDWGTQLVTPREVYEQAKDTLKKAREEVARKKRVFEAGEASAREDAKVIGEAIKFFVLDDEYLRDLDAFRVVMKGRINSIAEAAERVSKVDFSAFPELPFPTGPFVLYQDTDSIRLSVKLKAAEELKVDPEVIDDISAEHIVDIFIGTVTTSLDDDKELSAFDKNPVDGFGITREELLTANQVPAAVMDVGYTGLIDAIGRTLVEATMEGKTVYRTKVDVATVIFNHGVRP